MTPRPLVRFVPIVLAALLVASAAHADVTPTLQYQGRVTDNTGAALNGPQTLVFSIFPDSTSTTALFSQTFSNWPVVSGQFAVVFSGFDYNLTNALNQVPAKRLFVQTSVGGVQLNGPGSSPYSPRQPISSVLTAMRSQLADTARVALASAAADVPGVAWATRDSLLLTRNVTPPGTLFLRSVGVSMDVPAAGWVVVEATATVAGLTQGDVHCVVSTSASTDPTSVAGMADTSHQSVACGSTNPSSLSVHAVKVFAISAGAVGPQTWYFDVKPASANFPIQMSNITLVAHYVARHY